MSYTPCIIMKRKTEIDLDNWHKFDVDGGDRPKYSNQYRCLYYYVDINWFKISFRYFDKTTQTWYYDNVPFNGKKIECDIPAYWQLEESESW